MRRPDSTTTRSDGVMRRQRRHRPVAIKPAIGVGTAFVRTAPVHHDGGTVEPGMKELLVGPSRPRADAFSRANSCSRSSIGGSDLLGMEGLNARPWLAAQLGINS